MSMDVTVAQPDQLDVQVELPRVPRVWFATDKGRKGDPGIKGDQGPSGALTPGPLASRPVTAEPGQLFTATDTGDSFVWTGTVWAPTNRSKLLALVQPSAQKILTFGAVNTAVSDVVLTTGDVQMPSAPVRVTAFLAGTTTGTPASLLMSVGASVDGGATWTPIDAWAPFIGPSVIRSTSIMMLPANYGGPTAGQTARFRMGVQTSASGDVGKAFTVQADNNPFDQRPYLLVERV